MHCLLRRLRRNDRDLIILQPVGGSMIIKLIQPRMTLRPMDTKLKPRMAPSLGMSPQELGKGYLWMCKRFYSFRIILRRMPKNKRQRTAFTLFNFLYRKFGRFGCRIASLFSFGALGKLARRWGTALNRQALFSCGLFSSIHRFR